MVENQFSCGLIPAEIAEEALQKFFRHDHQSELIEIPFRPMSRTDLEVQERISNLVWRQMLEEFPHAVVNIKPNDD